MLDTIIRGGTIIDGTGTAGAAGDIAIADGKIVSVGGRVTDAARETIDADGALVTPGFVDIHTHYDGQYLWDDALDSSFSNGVTTAIAGNCGVGFAPARPEYRRQLVEMMEGVEDIPGIVLDAGLDWDWRSFPDYLNRVAARRYTMDVKAAITHAPLRVFVMGERALKHEKATAEDIAEMARLVREAMAAGACGFSAGRIMEHRSSVGDYIPGTFSDAEEMIEIGRSMGAYGTGVFQVVPLGASGDILGYGVTHEQRAAEHGLLVKIAKASSRPLTYLLIQGAEDPEEWRTMVAASRIAAAVEGVTIRPQVSPRQIGLLLTIDGYHIFQCRPSYMAIAHLPRIERVRAMREPELRRKILSEADCPLELAPTRMVHFFANRFATMLETFYNLAEPIDYEPDESRRLDRIGAATGRPMNEVLYDLLSEGEGCGIAAQFAYNYSGGTLAAPYEQMQNPQILSGLSDGGAHLLLSCDGSMPTFQLSFWARDRKRGPKLPIELMVHRLTGDPAGLYDMHDRGTLTPGKRADINVINFDTLAVDIPRMQFDLPEGGGRLIQRSQGYLATMVNGITTRRFDQDTGARPGRLHRSRSQSSDANPVQHPMETE
jgi:N-acyl-D-amino-acid deacylase